MRSKMWLVMMAVAMGSGLGSGCGKKETAPAMAEAVMPAAATDVQLEVATSGAAVGRWTMDYDAALKVAAEQNLPVLLMFTGSDWCPYCRDITQKVLATPEWQGWVSDKMLQVYVDFPRNEALVPEPFRQRNQELQSRYGIEGFPSFVVLDSDGRVLNRVGLRNENTFTTFRRDVRASLRARRAYIERTISRLPAERQPQIRASYEKLQADKQLLADKNKEFQETLERMREELEKLGASVENDLLSAFVATLPEEQQQRYREADQKLSATVDALKEWLQGEPAQNPENTQKYNAFMQTMQEQRDIIADIIDVE